MKKGSEESREIVRGAYVDAFNAGDGRWLMRLVPAEGVEAREENRTQLREGSLARIMVDAAAIVSVERARRGGFTTIVEISDAYGGPRFEVRA